jgi:hypothetical protein
VYPLPPTSTYPRKDLFSLLYFMFLIKYILIVQGWDHLDISGLYISRRATYFCIYNMLKNYFFYFIT